MVRFINSSYEISTFDACAMLKRIEDAGRTAYKSEGKATENSADKFIRMLIKRGHESVLEHCSISVRIICDRGVTHEIVRHRIASYTQESTRYCNYSDDRFGNQITVIDIFDVMDDYETIKDVRKAYAIWKKAMENAENSYMELSDIGCPPEISRGVLPNSLKTEIVITMNLREWRHFFRLRISPKAHPQMREVTIPMFTQFAILLPAVFEDIPR